jgi:hypothetical protein
MDNFIKDVVLHVKTKLEDVGIVKKTIYPITRWEDVLGAPRLLDQNSIDEAYPSEYAFYNVEDITISDEEYKACFKDII